jgi:hypothetical protein
VQQRPGNVNPPPLSAGESAHRALQQLLKFQHLRQGIQSRFKGLACDAIQCRPTFQIVPDGKLLIQH